MATRYQVRAGAKKWTDAGPDLFRSLKGATDAFSKLIPDGHVQTRREQPDGTVSEWHDASHAGAMRRLDSWYADKDSSIFQVGVGGEVKAVIRRRVFDVTSHAGDSAKVDLYGAMVMEAFPGTLWAGGYVYKETSPGYWSDHAWGDAFDVTPKKAPNDAVFDWMVRMARAGEMDFAYIIGSRAGSVVSATASSGYAVKAGGGDSSHLWHCHVSVIDHGGAKPPKTGGHS